MNNNALKTKEVISLLKVYGDNTFRCPYCLNVLYAEYDTKNVYYCSNEMCLNENKYNKKGMCINE